MKLTFLLFLILITESFAAKPLCFAHRGAGKKYFDNSLSAIKGAIEEKLEGIEIDIQSTKDGELILLHDPDLSEVAEGKECPLHTPISEQIFSSIRSTCELHNGETIPTLKEVFTLLHHPEILILLDLKSPLNDKQIKDILESNISPARLRLSAFYPHFLERIKKSSILTNEQLEIWNAIPRYENFRHPVFSKTEFHKNFHLFSAMAFGLWRDKAERFGAWEVNYTWFMKMISALNPEFVVTKIPGECMALNIGTSFQ